MNASELYDHEAETQLLACLLSGETPERDQAEIYLAIKQNHFGDVRYGAVFDAAKALFGDGKPVMLASISQRLHESGQLEKIGGVSKINEVLECMVTAANVAHWAAIVEDLAKRRALVQIAVSLREKALDAGTNRKELVDATGAELNGVESADGQGLVDAKVLLRDWVAETERKHNEKQAPGIDSGFYDLDAKLRGTRPGNMLVIGARPGVGKTSLALGMAENALKAGHKPLVFSLEMTAQELIERRVSMRSGVPSDRLRDPRNLIATDWPRLTNAVNVLGQAGFTVIDKGNIGIADIRMLARLAKIRHGCDIAFVDYLQLISTPKTNQREREVALISKGLKDLAKELQIPIVVLSQLNRAIESRAEMIPRLSDLRESGAIEQDADAVILLHNPAMYDENAPSDEIVVYVAKNRHGGIGPLKLGWDEKLTKFYNQGVKNGQ